MPPKNKSKKFQKKVAAKEKDTKENGDTNGVHMNGNGNGHAISSPADEIIDVTRTAAGVLESEKGARDIKIGSFSLSFHQRILVEESSIELNHGRRYGLIGQNGCGKSTFLKSLAAREVPIPKHIDVYLLDQEAPPSELTAVEYVVISAKQEVERLEKEADHILVTDGPDSPELMGIYERLDELDPTTFEARASKILHGLGFNSKTMEKKTQDMSGGWRMRVALAKALFIQPTMLLLDEPTNHLDLEACVWLEDHLSTYSKILLVVSHSQDFLNGVCTDMIVMQRQKLKYWGGNYDTYVRTRREQDANQLKLYKKQQDEIAHIKKFIASCGTYANLVRQAKSRQKQLDKMVEAGLIEMPYEDPVFRFYFPQCGKLPPPVVSFINCAFSYSGRPEDYLYTGLDFGIDCDSRIALVGPNGAGKSTLLKLMVDEISPCEGQVSRRSGLSIGRYHQHSADQLDFDLSPVQYIQKQFPGLHEDAEKWRSEVGRFGITGDQQLKPIAQLSDGMRTRLCLCEIALRNPHILLLDEPTNHCDMEMIDSLADAIKKFDGGTVLVSHDFRLLEQVAEEIWVVDHGISKWRGDIRTYKEYLRSNMEK